MKLPTLQTAFVHSDVLAVTANSEIPMDPKTETEKQFLQAVKNEILDMVHPAYPHAQLERMSARTFWVWLTGKKRSAHVPHENDRSCWVELTKEQLTLLNEATDVYMSYFDANTLEADFVKYRKVEDLNDYIGEPLARMHNNPNERTLANIQIRTNDPYWGDQVPRTLPRRAQELISIAFAELIDEGVIDITGDYNLS